MESHMALDVNNSVWFQYLLSDAMHLYSLLWSTQEHFDWLQGFPPSNTSMRYKAKALCLLQKRLGEDSLAISNTTIVAVVTLLFFTALKGDHECATKHMAGLHKIVTLRGGLYSLKENKQVHLSVCRCVERSPFGYKTDDTTLMLSTPRADLSVALVNGTLPLFSSEGQSWGRDSALPSPPRPPIPSCPVARIVDPRLSDIESELRTICASANRTFHTKEKLTPGAFQDQLIRIEYCLMALMFSPADFNETLRLGLLAFATAIFLQPQGVKVWFERLSRKLRDSIFTADWAMIEILGYRLWLLFVAGLSDPTVDDGHWLHPLLFSALQDAQLTTWESVRSRLKSFPWIDTLHDAGGKRLFDLTTIVMTQSRKATATDYHALAI